MRKFLMVFAFMALILFAAVPLVAQTAGGNPVEVADVLPGAVIALAIAATAIIKRYAPVGLVRRFIWLPSVIVGIVGALLLTDLSNWRLVIWNAICYAGIASYLVLIVKRLGEQPQVPDIPEKQTPLVR